MNSLLFILVALPCVTLAIDTLKPFNQTATLSFLVTDTNYDGFIDHAEIVHTFRDYDLNHNGRISRTEYTSYVQSHTPNLYDVSHYLYDIYDVDNDDQLDQHDFENFFALMDGNSDGLVNHFEYVRFYEIHLSLIEQQLNGGRIAAPDTEEKAAQ